MLSVSLTGCAGYRIVRTVDAVPMEPKAAPQVTSEMRGKDYLSTLSAIEEFLERTRDFHVADTMTPRVGQSPAAQSRLKDFDIDVDPGFEPDNPVQVYTRSIPQTDHKRFSKGMIVANNRVGLENQRPVKTVLVLPIVQSVAISVVATPKPVTLEPAEINTSNQSLEVKPEDQEISLDRYVMHLESKASLRKDFESEWQLHLMHLVMGRDDRALGISNDISEGTQTLLRSLLNAVIAVRDMLRNPSAKTEDTLVKVDELRRVITEHSDPQVSMVALCRQVVTFGVYDEMSREDLMAGRTTQTIIYSEIENFSSESTGDGHYETRLGSRLELLTADGQSIWQKEEPEIVDRCRRRRKDFFIAQRVTFPPTLPAGHYVLKVMVEDKLTGRVGEAIHPFEISAPTSIARNQ